MTHSINMAEAHVTVIHGITKYITIEITSIVVVR